MDVVSGRVLAQQMRGPRFSLCPNLKIMAIREHISLIFNFLGNGFIFIITVIILIFQGMHLCSFRVQGKMAL